MARILTFDISGSKWETVKGNPGIALFISDKEVRYLISFETVMLIN